MSEKNLGNSFSWFLAVVVNVTDDPDQAGRVQIRVFGRHDDTQAIPDKALPWAMPLQGLHSAAIGRIGTAPLGLVKSSKVIGFWADADQQYPILIGTFGKAGDAVPGATVNGAEKVDLTKGSIPAPAQNMSAPVAYNPYSRLFPGKITLTDINSGKADITSLLNTTGIINTIAINQLLGQPGKPTIAGLLKTDLSDVLNLVKQVDPKFASTVLPNLIDTYMKIRDLLGLSSPAGITSMLQKALTGMLGNLAQVMNPSSLISMMTSVLASGNLNPQAAAALASAVSTVAAQVAAGSVPPSSVTSTETEAIDPAAPVPSLVVATSDPGYVQQFFSTVTSGLLTGVSANPYPGYIQWINPLTGAVEYTVNTSPVYSSPSDQLSGTTAASMQAAVQQAISSGQGIPGIVAAINAALSTLQSSALSTALGSNVNLNSIVSLAKQLIPQLGNILGGLESTLVNLIGGKFGELFGALVGPPQPKPVNDAMTSHVVHQAHHAQVVTNATKAVATPQPSPQAPTAADVLDAEGTGTPTDVPSVIQQTGTPSSTTSIA